MTWPHADPASRRAWTQPGVLGQVYLAQRHLQEAPAEIEPGAEWLERSYIGAAVHIDATFFNTGTGDLNDDVGGHIAQGFGTDFRRIE